MSAPAGAHVILAGVLARVRDALIECKRDVGQTGIPVGGVALDEGCEGALFVSPERIFRWTTPFPTEAGADDQVVWPMIAVTIVVRLFRCTPSLDDVGNPPSPEAVDVAAAGVLTDAAVIWRVVNGEALVATADFDDDMERAAVEQTFTAELGGFVGVETRFTLGVPYRDWCDVCR